MRPEAGADRPARLLAHVVRGLPATRAEWGAGMCAELVGVEGARARRSFSLGCATAVLGMRLRASVTAPGRGGVASRAVMLAAVAAAVALAAYGLVRYPGLRSGVGAWAAVTAFLVLMLGYVAAALTLSRGTTTRATIARRYGLAGGLVVGAAWLMVAAPIAPAQVEKSFFFVPLAIALLGPAVVAALAARAGRDARAATAAALWSGLVGGLLAFIIWVSTTYVRDGRPYDAGMLRDFRASGSHDLAAYAIADNLGAALGMLVFIPVVALALGSLTGRVAADLQS